MTRARPPHFSDPPVIFETFIALLWFLRQKLQICKVTDEIMPRSGMRNPM